MKCSDQFLTPHQLPLGCQPVNIMAKNSNKIVNLKMGQNLSEKVKKMRPAIAKQFSRDPHMSVKVFCNLCDNVHMMSGLRKHIAHKHGMTMTKYKEMYGTTRQQIIQLVYHSCEICHNVLLLNTDDISKHTIKYHKLGYTTYMKLHMQKGSGMITAKTNGQTLKPVISSINKKLGALKAKNTRAANEERLKKVAETPAPTKVASVKKTTPGPSPPKKVSQPVPPPPKKSPSPAAPVKKSSPPKAAPVKTKTEKVTSVPTPVKKTPPGPPAPKKGSTPAVKTKLEKVVPSEATPAKQSSPLVTPMMPPTPPATPPTSEYIKQEPVMEQMTTLDEAPHTKMEMDLPVNETQMDVDTPLPSSSTSLVIIQCDVCFKIFNKNVQLKAHKKKNHL